MSQADRALELFVTDGAARIARLADPGLRERIPQSYHAAAQSVSRQAGREWRIAFTDDQNFSFSSAFREFRVPRSFKSNCERVLEMVKGSADPELRPILATLGGDDGCDAALMSAFFHIFACHEFLHVEQHLGSDQYVDSDSYMSIVMEADQVADAAGLVMAVALPIPELLHLDERERVLLLVAIHIAAMYGFGSVDDPGIDAYPFSRMLVWFLHFARFSKAEGSPDFASPVFARGWIVALPRLIGRADFMVTTVGLEERAADPYPASSDVVLAYHHEDGIYRIHRAVFTDRDRVLRLATSVVAGSFDAVRAELEELLINNPALIPQVRRTPDMEWVAGQVLERVEALAACWDAGAVAADAALIVLRADYERLRTATTAMTRNASDAGSLVLQGDKLIAAAEQASAGRDFAAFLAARRRMLSVVDQIALLAI